MLYKFIYLLIVLQFLKISSQKEIVYTNRNITSLNRYDHYVYIYENSHLKKNEVLNIKNEFDISYYCKNDICVKVDCEYDKDFIEFPNKEGKINIYIVKTFLNINDELINYYNKMYSNKTYVSINCSNDSDCLSNKCFNNYCIFNNETPIVHCDSIYTGNRKSYMYCGKPYEDYCNTNDECSSKNCNSISNYCLQPRNGPSDSDSAVIIGYFYLFYIFLIIIMVIVVIFYFLYKFYKIILNKIIINNY